MVSWLLHHPAAGSLGRGAAHCILSGNGPPCLPLLHVTRFGPRIAWHCSVHASRFAWGRQDEPEYRLNGHLSEHTPTHLLASAGDESGCTWGGNHHNKQAMKQEPMGASLVHGLHKLLRKLLRTKSWHECKTCRGSPVALSL